MRRSALLILAAALAMPAAVEAQKKPSNSLHTRSMTLYLTEARNSSHPDDKRAALAKALEVGLEGAQKDGDNPQVWYLLGQTYLEQGDLAGADSAFTRAEEIWPDYRAETEVLRETAWVNAYNQAVRALQDGDDAAALEAFTRAVNIYEGRPDALLSLAQLQARTNDAAAAEESYRRALAIIRGADTETLDEKLAAEWAESEEVAAFNLARLLADQEKYDAAATIFEEFAARHPQNVQARVNQALMYSQANQAERAAEIYAQLLEQPGLDEIDYFNIGIGLYRADQHDQAATAFRKSVEANPYGRDAVFNLGQAQFAQANARLVAGDTTGAVAAFAALGETAKELLALDPGSEQAYMMLAQSQRSRAELGGEATLRQDALATLEKANALPFRVNDVRVEMGDGVATVTGSAVNGATLAAGTEGRIQFFLVDRAGAELASQTIAVPLGAQDAAVEFTAEIPVDGEVAGWKYEIVR